MEEIKDFIKRFLADEQTLIDAYLEPLVNDQQYGQVFEKYCSNFHFSMDAYTQLYSRRNQNLLNDSEKLAKTMSRFIKRVVFYIAHYSQPEFGAELASHVAADQIYTFAVSNTQKSGRPDKSFKEKLYVGMVQGEPKIIYNELFMLGQWERPHGYDPLFVTSPGQLKTVEKLIMPEEEASIAAYNSIG